MRRRIKQKCYHKNTTVRKLTLFAVSAALALMAYLIHVGMAPVIKTVSGNQARILCTNAINRGVVAELSARPIQYDTLVTIIYDAAGNIAALNTNTMEVNRIKSALTMSVNQVLSELPQQDVRIPLGTLTGIELLSGLGPGVRLRMIPSAFIESALTSNFESAGINQTRHELVINFKVEMSAIIAPYTTTVVITASVVIAETVIVGVVPNFFAGSTAVG